MSTSTVCRARQRASVIEAFCASHPPKDVARRLTKKKIIRVRTKATNLEYLNHIKELPVYISHNSDWGCDVYNIALLHQELFCFGAYCFYDRVREQFLLIESFDAFIQVNTCCMLRQQLSAAGEPSRNLPGRLGMSCLYRS